MVKRRVLWPVAGGLVGAAVVAAALAGAFGGSGGGRDAAARTTVSPAPVASSAVPTPTPTRTPTPTPRPSHRRHAVVAHAPVVSRHRTGRSSGAGQADPCAHNHHCYVPPLPPLTPEPQRPPVAKPSITITGAPAGG